MSRVAKKPVIIPVGVEVTISGSNIKIKGPKGTVQIPIHEDVEIKKDGDVILFVPKDGDVGADAFAGTARALVNNMVIGVTTGFTRKLILIGVGFKAQIQGKILNLALGFSHPIKFEIPVEVTIETPTQTEIIIKGTDKHIVGQVAAKIRAYRPPEPYKGKGVRYDDEVVVKKEGKKK
ncbi:MAG: 50S ribosomal protein L6 [Gammaproteobacteria bacterium]|nr:50S ribosomal protein L6 [Gammaproteobacteria bacterium]